MLSWNSGHSQEPLSILKQMISYTNSVQALEFTLDSKERINGKIIHEINLCKISTNPYKIYAIQSVPLKKLEVLYVTGNNGGKLKINPASFPWVTINLHPDSPLILNSHHHTVLEAGFAYFIAIIEKFIQKNENKGPRILEKFSKTKIYGSDCYIITLVNPEYRFSDYMVSSRETPLSIAKKLSINYYSILENNPGLKATEEIAPGSKVRVPNDYASKIELFINQDKLYPVNLKVYDPKGLFEEYTFTDVDINPEFDTAIFSTSNPQYGF
jgi:hypothetical protein